MPPPPLPQDDLEIIEPLCAVFRRKLKAEGLKYTPERARILDAIVGRDGLFEADELLSAVNAGGERVSKATVYRTIRLLQDAGIIQRVLFDEDQAHYQLVYGRSPHDLLIRLDTRHAETIDLPELIALRDRICRERGLEPRGHRLHIFAVGRPS
ncbi:MAG: transcriptional repressor [Phycisphaeraceae bacterium]|nr:transcriptional repressor [Phycisphaeraceae bacterium]